MGDEGRWRGERVRLCLDALTADSCMSEVPAPGHERSLASLWNVPGQYTSIPVCFLSSQAHTTLSPINAVPGRWAP